MIDGPLAASLILIAFGCIALWIGYEAEKGIKKSNDESKNINSKDN